MNREEKFIHFFSHLTKDNLNQINDVFASGAHFKDPFNDVIGINAIYSVFDHMFATTDDPRFIVNHYASNEKKLFIQWKFTFYKNNKNWSIDGSSMITFNSIDGSSEAETLKTNQVIEHIDYWDPAEQIYSKIGLLKPIMNFLKSRLTAQ